MKIIDPSTGLDSEWKAELHEVCDRLAGGTATSSETKFRALANLKKLQDEIRNRIGVQSVAVDLVRHTRDRQ